MKRKGRKRLKPRTNILRKQKVNGKRKQWEESARIRKAVQGRLCGPGITVQG